MDRAWPMLAALVAIAGCVAPASGVEPLSAADARPSLRAAPALVVLAPGASYAAVWLNATADDWTRDDRGWSLRLGFEFPDASLLYAFAAYEAKDGHLDPLGMAYGVRGGAASLGLGEDAPRDASFLALLVASEVASPTAVRLGLFDAFPDFELEGEPQPATLLEAGGGAALAAYWELATPRSAVAPFPVVSSGMTVKDSRAHPPLAPTVAAAAGVLDLSFEHDVGAAGVHLEAWTASAADGARAARWAYASTTDGRTQRAAGVLAETPAAGVWASGARGGPIEASTGASLRITEAAGVFPLTRFHAATAPLDLAAHGLVLEPHSRAFLPLPVAFATPEGCHAPGEAAPTLAACDLRAAQP